MAAELKRTEYHTMLFGIKEGSGWIAGMWGSFKIHSTRCCWYISDYGLTFEADLTAECVHGFIQKYEDDLEVVCDMDHCADNTKPDFGDLAGW